MIKQGDFIYAGQLKSKLAISIEEAYQILEELKNEGFLTNLYEIYCHDCNKSTGKFLDSLEEFNPEAYCDKCDADFTLEKNLIVLYKVVSI